MRFSLQFHPQCSVLPIHCRVQPLPWCPFSCSPQVSCDKLGTKTAHLEQIVEILTELRGEVIAALCVTFPDLPIRSSRTGQAQAEVNTSVKDSTQLSQQCHREEQVFLLSFQRESIGEWNQHLRTSPQVKTSCSQTRTVSPNESMGGMVTETRSNFQKIQQ